MFADKGVVRGFVGKGHMREDAFLTCGCGM
jgi:hypothetical protein